MENWEEEAEETDLYPRPKVPGKNHNRYLCNPQVPVVDPPGTLGKPKVPVLGTPGALGPNGREMKITYGTGWTSGTGTLGLLKLSFLSTLTGF